METRKELSTRKGPNVDRISSLPDSILSHILSFLPTKSSAATSILARRWRFLWADVPNIHLDFQSHRDWNKERPRTSDIINRILFLGHNLKALNTFRLKLANSNAKCDVNQHQLETWIAAVIARGKVQNIELDFSYCLKLPECLFIYKSLVDLRLYKCEIRISELTSICFPCLEKLHLCFVKYNNDETFQHLISGCSVLEELVIKCDRDEIVSCRIFSPTLKWLTVDFQFFAPDCRVEIITPALRYLHLQHSSKNISAQSLSSVTEADIRFSMKEYDEVYSRSVLEFLDRMSNVKCLRSGIHRRTFYQSAFSIWSPRFHNLTKLELAAGWRLISKFLEISENLQVLVIDMFGNPESWLEPQQVFTCLLSHLTSIVIKNFGRGEHEFMVVRYLLKNAKVLTSMKICGYIYLKERFAAMKKISLFERGSEACKLYF